MVVTNKEQKPVLKVEDVSKSFPIQKGILRREVARLHAVRNISFDVYPEETIGIVGESGCGKSTLAKTIVKLYNPTQGRIELLGNDIANTKGKKLRSLRKHIQMIFQDPLDSLNPRMTIFDILSEPYKIHGIKLSYDELKSNISNILKTVGVPVAALSRYSHEFSGGQCQRIGIARALTLNPKLLICDEPVSALDVSVQSQVINLFLKLQKEMGLSYVFISHDLTVVRHISDKVLVMYLGEMVEYTDAISLYTTPLHPYTKALLATIPSIEKRGNTEHI
ncbi:MAG: ATP-binding cassette domain-containing protein, partial [Proteobacteria bacterium]|nr:ATP-binding cassette domain-containing protein [Pseudomonadota bacterium]